MIEECLKGDYVAIRKAKDLVRKYDISETEAINIVVVWKFNIKVAEEAIKGLRERGMPSDT